MVKVSKTFPPQKQVLKDIYLSFFYGAKIGIIGLNGSGKSTLLKIIAGVEKSFQGDVVFSPGYRVGYLEQDPQLDDSKTVIEIVREGVQPIMDILAEYNEVNEKMGLEEYYMDGDKMDKLLARQGVLQDEIDSKNAWEIDSTLERAMDALRCPDSDRIIGTLSGGERDDDAAFGTCGPRWVARVFGGLHRSVAEPHVGPVSGRDARSVWSAERGLQRVGRGAGARGRHLWDGGRGAAVRPRVGADRAQRLVFLPLDADL
jgi:hypothetical protein